MLDLCKHSLQGQASLLGWGGLGGAGTSPSGSAETQFLHPLPAMDIPCASPAVFWSFALQQIKKKNPICSKTFGLLK